MMKYVLFWQGNDVYWEGWDGMMKDRDQENLATRILGILWGAKFV